MKRQSGLLQSTAIKKHHQLGVAGIWAALTLVPVMGFTFLAVEGTRYVQESSRLKDSAEAAALAVTIQDNGIDDADVMTEGYVQAYVRDIASDSVSATRTEDDEEGYIQYDVAATTTHNSWFASNFIPSFGDTQTLVSESTAKKYYSYSNKNIDLVFVSDFSGSMTYYTYSSSSNGWRTKISFLKEAISEISSELLCATDDVKEDDSGNEYCDDDDLGSVANKLDNRIGFVPFNIRTREQDDDGNTYAVSQLRYLTGYQSSASSYTYDDVDWNAWRTYDFEDVYTCSEDKDDCPSGSSSEKKQAQRIVDVLGIEEYSYTTGNGRNKTTKYSYSGSSYPDQYDYVDFDTSVSDMLNNKFTSDYSTYYKIDNMIDLYAGYGSSSSSQFYNIELTNSMADLEAVDDMSANGSTAVFQGLLRGIQVLYDGKPDDSASEEAQEEYADKIKMIIILSDGQESPDNDIFPDLVSAGLCDQARSDIENLYIGVVGIAFSASGQTGFQNCVEDSSTDIIDVDDMDELIEKIEDLIENGATTNGVTTLY